MKATVYYITLTEAQRAELNDSPLGWGCALGCLYLAAKDGDIGSNNIDLFARAATVEIDPDDLRQTPADAIWTRLQNVENSWTEATAQHDPGSPVRVAAIHTDFPRSMDVGDVIVFEDGSAERCHLAGWGNLGDFTAGLFRAMEHADSWPG